jgi:hypothetical protein
LGALDYRTREEATQQLMLAGPQVMEPLAKAAQSEDLEVSYRAVRVLQSLLGRDDQAAQQAATTLESVAAREQNLAAPLANDALAFYRLTLQDRIINDLWVKYGAPVRPVGNEQLEFEPTALKAVIDSNWKGTNEELKLLKQIRNLQWVHIVNVRLDEACLQTISELSEVVKLDLYRTGVSNETVRQKLSQKMAGVKIEVRNGAMIVEHNELIEQVASLCTVPSELAMVAGSDAHTLRRVARTWTEAPVDGPSDISGFLTSLRACRSRPAAIPRRRRYACASRQADSGSGSAA